MKLNDKVYEVLKWIYGSRVYTVGRRYDDEITGQSF